MSRPPRPSLALRSAILLGCLALAPLPSARAAEPLPAARIVADRVLQCSVGITCSKDDFINHTGTGIVVSSDGHILTATSTVPAGAEKIRVLFPGFVTREATIVAVDDALAVSLIKVDASDLPCLPLAQEMPEVGSTAYTAGDVENALRANGRASFSRGIVSGIYTVPKNPEALYTGVAIETTAAINPGSDGGPLVNERGQLSGVITLGILPLRWQGTAVPTKVLLERFAPFASGAVKLDFQPLAGLPARKAADHPLRVVADDFAKYLVGIDVERRFKPEMLPRVSWEEYRELLGGWDKLPKDKRVRKFAEFANVAKVMEVNQLLRRPAGPFTGVVISPDGDVLTSLFNVGGDNAVISKKTGAPRTFGVSEPIEKLFRDPDGGLERKDNAITKISVVLADGSRREATLRAKHEPLGVALLKIEAEDLPWLDLAGATVSPQLGDAVGLIGYVPGEKPGYTLNSGIISAPARLRGFLFQTDALLNYGNSGGPAFDRAGNFLGLAAAPIEPDTLLGQLVPPPQLMMWRRAPNSGVGMISRGDRIRDAIEGLKAGRSVQRIPGPILGVEPDESKAFTETVVLGGVAPGTPAERAGLKRGDVIVEFNGMELQSWPELQERISACKAGESVQLKIQRRGGGPRLMIKGREVETLDDLQKLKKALKPGETFEGVLSTDDTRDVTVVLGESR
ncbi:MAG: S1C family serine protease [Planctomycetia bacterium]|jgi:S1-C subfamily serine protease